MQTRTERDEALARSRLYTLCQQLYLDGVTAQLLPILSALPDLAAHLPTAVTDDPGMALDQTALDQMAAGHQELFGFNLFPYESIFLESKGLLGSALTEQVIADYDAIGYLPTSRAGAPDHMGEELGILAHLCAAEADAWEDERVGIIRRMQREQRRFMESHLLRWLVPCMIAIQRHEDAFFVHLSVITTELVTNHYTTLARQEENAPDIIPVGWSLPAAPNLLDNPQTSLKDIAHFLTTPAYSGIFLSRYLISRLGRDHRLPRGFGSREQMLTNLLRTAAQYDALPALLTSMKSEVRTWQQTYETAANAQPDLASFIQPWAARVTETGTMLTQIDVALVGHDR